MKNSKASLQKAWSKTIIGLAVALLLYAVIMLAISNDRYYLQILTLAAINVIMAVSLNLINGFTGQFSIGHAGFMGVGAYTAAFLTTEFKLPFLVALLLGSLGAALVGFLVGMPTLRLRGDYLAIATLGFGEIIRVVIINLDAVGGSRGYIGISRVTNFAWAYAFAVFTILIIRHFINSTHGRACLAIREDEVAAGAMGVDTTKYKVMAFSIGAGFAGLAGGLFAHLLTFLHPSSFDFTKSVDFLVMVVVGGWGSITGPASAAVAITIVNELLRQFAEYRMLAYAVILIAIMLFRPQGLLAGKEFTLPDKLVNFFATLFQSRRASGKGQSK
ncbi:MAG: branched-chain amino acid ABC transporter permease, partial [bacterium]|nr:branched-chain amino acid ABC transporter permease [bacterium]